MAEDLADLGEPTPVDDFRERVKICRENGIRALKDGKLEIIFTSAPKSTLTMGEMALRDRAVADSER